jgi:hypothetical protein
MSNDEAISTLLADLGAADPRDRVAVLQVLVEDPTGDARIRAAVEALLADRTVTMLMIPPAYGEVRWLAALALSAELHAIREPDLVPLPAAVAPVSGPELSQLAIEHLGPQARHWTREQCYERLRDAGVLIARDRALRGPLRV